MPCHQEPGIKTAKTAFEISFSTKLSLAKVTTVAKHHIPAIRNGHSASRKRERERERERERDGERKRNKRNKIRSFLHNSSIDLPAMCEFAALR